MLEHHNATINLRDPGNVYGGSLFDGEADRKYRTTIHASPAPGTPAIAANAINTPTTAYGLVVSGKDETATDTGWSVPARGLTLTRSVLAAGKRGDGAPGGMPRAGQGGSGQPAIDSSAAQGAGGGQACPSS